jgi:hypothetical protein
MENDFNLSPPPETPVSTPLSPTPLPSQETVNSPQINQDVGGTINPPPKGKKIIKIIIILVITILMIVAAGVLVFQYFMQKSKNSVKDTVSTSAPLPTNPVVDTVVETLVSTDCSAFPDKLESCTKYTCIFTDPVTGEKINREITGILNDKCKYLEGIPNGGIMSCKYSENMRKVVAQYYRDTEKAASVSAEAKLDLKEDKNDIETTYKLNGKVLVNPVQEALETGECVVLD